MFNKFFKKSKVQLSINKKKLSKNGEDITEWEKNFMENTHYKCPNCESGSQTLLPIYHRYQTMGMSQNIRCHVCGQGYNVMGPFGIQNIGINKSYIDEQYMRSLKLNKIKKHGKIQKS